MQMIPIGILKLQRDEAILKLKDLQMSDDQEGDEEIAHIEADKILCDLLRTLGYEDVVAEWDAITPKWYA